MLSCSRFIVAAAVVVGCYFVFFFLHTDRSSVRPFAHIADTLIPVQYDRTFHMALPIFVIENFNLENCMEQLEKLLPYTKWNIWHSDGMANVHAWERQNVYVYMCSFIR